MNDFVAGVVTGAVGGIVGTIVGGYLLDAVIWQKKRIAFVRMLRQELENFQGHMHLPPLAGPRHPQLVSTVNATLLENALTSAIWDPMFDSKIIAKLADLVEQVKRYNDKVRVVNSFAYGPAFAAQATTDEYRAYAVLHSQLAQELSEISAVLDGFAGMLDDVLSWPSYYVSAFTRARRNALDR